MSDEARFGLCRNVEHVLDIGRDFQDQDRLHGAHYDTVKPLCDTIEYLRDQLPKPDPDWEAICERCCDGDLEPDCEYYGEPNGCNSPIYGEHPKVQKTGNAAAMREALVAWLNAFDEFVQKPRDGKWTQYPCGTLVLTPLCAAKLVDMTNSALSAPPRNCDRKFADRPAMYYEFKDWCNKKGHTMEPKLAYDAFDWLLEQSGEKGDRQ
jgi:hypothetical protein